MLLLSGEGQQRLISINTALAEAGIKPATAGDIWSDRGVSLLGICEYYIDADWDIIELVVAATPFSDESHTGPAIEEKTEAAFDRAAILGLQHERVFLAVSDNGANMVAGWMPFGGGPCAVHTMQLSVNMYLQHEAVKPTRDKQKGITAHFNKSTGVDGLNGLQKCQRQCQATCPAPLPPPPPPPCPLWYKYSTLW